MTNRLVKLAAEQDPLTGLEKGTFYFSTLCAPGSTPSFASFGYTYNPVGNITGILDNVNATQTRSFTYDALQRLKVGGTTGAAESYDYDLVGNRTTSFLSFTHVHDTTNRLTEDDDFTYSYDANGNLETKTSKAVPTDITTYAWDAQDQLIQITFPNSTTATYKYDWSSPTASDTGLSCRLKCHWNPLSYSRVISQPIVIDFDVFKDTGLCSTPSHIAFPMNKFNVQGVEEAFGDRVIVTGCPSPHATTQLIVRQQSLVAF